MRHLLNPNALKTRNLYRNADTEDEEFWREPGQFGPRNPDVPLPREPMVLHEDRAPAFAPIGLLDAHGTPLVRYVIPIVRPIGFGAIHPDDDGAEAVVYITTEAEIKAEQTDAGRSDEPQFDDPEPL